MAWNYRVVIDKEPKSEGVFFSVRDVYYAEDGKVVGWAESPEDVVAGDMNSLVKVISKYQKAITQPVLVVDDNKFIKEISLSEALHYKS